MQRLTRSFVMTGALAFAGVLAGCGDDVSVQPDPAISVTPQTVSLKIGESATLTASVTGLSNRAVTWSTSDQAKVTVDANGKVTAVAVGNATITATAAGDADLKQSALVTVTGRGVNAITVSPNNDILAPGQTRQLTANVDAEAGVARTVTWTSSATGTATVSNTGVVTAVAPGNATITATSTVDAAVFGTMALTVRTPQPASISIQKVTVTGNTTQTVNFNNVAGGIDVTLNVDPGEQILTRVEVLLDNAVVCSQNLSPSESDAMRLAAAFEGVAAVDVVCQINTAEFNTTTGAVKYLNGSHTLSARAIAQGGSAAGAASTSVNLTFNNQSGFVANVANANTVGGAASAINPTTGQNWVQGNITLTLTAVNYTAGGATVSAISGSFLTAGTQAVPATHVFTQVAPAAGTQVFTISYPNTGTSATNTVAYQSPNAGEFPLVTGSVLSNGQAGPTTILNLPASAANLGLEPLAPTRLDNVAPTVPAFAAAPLWVNASTSFAAGQLGTPTIASTTDTGVDNVAATFWVTSNGGSLTGAAATCNLTGLTQITTGSQLAETIVNTAYKVRVVYRDALGNPTCADLVGTGVGADFTAPNNVTFAGLANNAFFGTAGAGANAAATNYTLATTGDNASGIDAATPARISISRFNANETTTCVTGGTGCPMINAAISGSITGAATAEGYYTLTAQLSDVAGNATPTPAFSRLFLVDATAPAYTGTASLASTYAGNAPATFSGITVSDNLDLATLTGYIQYANAAVVLGYESLALGAYGTPLEKTFTGNYTVASLIRCVAPANTFALNNANKATQIVFRTLDQAGNSADLSPVAGALSAAVADCGAVGNLTAPAAINTFNQNAASYGAGKTQVDIDGANLVAASATSATLSAIADVTLDNSPEPFTRVEFYWLDPVTGSYQRIGQAPAGTLNQTVTTRTWTYSLAWDPGATVPVGNVTVIAVGIDAQGDAVITNTQVVVTVQ